MSRAAASRAGRSASAGRANTAILRAIQEYLVNSELPLTALLFLLPMIVLYEVGTRYFASDLVHHTETRVLAFSLVRQFMELFGATGQYLPGMLVVGILLTWHIARGDPWRLHLGTTVGMGFECILLAVPLLALSNLIGQYVSLVVVPQIPRGGLFLALGAGVYEELVFRLMGFTLLNILMIDLLRIEKKVAFPLIVLSSSILFAAYHYWSPQSAPFRWSDCIFRTASGIYFGTLFMTRGFGVTSGVHAAYDIYYFALHAAAG